jgi:hypothetical protein
METMVGIRVSPEIDQRQRDQGMNNLESLRNQSPILRRYSGFGRTSPETGGE